MSWYTEQLRNPKWQKKRLEILSRDGWACVLCKDDTINLQVDHLKYISGKLPWEYPNELLQTLCERCHYEKSVKNPKLVKGKDGSFRPAVAPKPSKPKTMSVEEWKAAIRRAY
jgi:5-methylcytosine-specific restriction endonuclease McrA